MKLYLAGPMTGYKDFNFPAFHKAAADLRAMGYEVFNPAEKDIELHGEAVFKGDGSHGAPNVPTLRECLTIDLAWICEYADGIALMHGWENSNGAKAENATATAIGLRRFIQTDDYTWEWEDRTMSHVELIARARDASRAEYGPEMHDLFEELAGALAEQDRENAELRKALTLCHNRNRLNDLRSRTPKQRSTPM